MHARSLQAVQSFLTAHHLLLVSDGLSLLVLLPLVLVLVHGETCDALQASSEHLRDFLLSGEA